MLPEQWKEEIEEAVDKATRTADEANKRAEEIQEKIARRIDAVADALNKYNEKQEREAPRNRTQYRWTLLALGAAAFFTLVLDLLSACQLRETQKVYGPIKDSADAATRAAETTSNLERPYIFAIAKPTKLASKEGPNDPNPTISYSETNVGRSPATIYWVSSQCLLVDNVSGPPMYPRGTFRDTLRVISPNNNDDTWPPCQFPSAFNDADWQALQDGKKFVLFLIVYVFSGPLDYTYYSTFGFRIDMFTGNAYAIGGSGYNRSGSIEGRTTDSLPKNLPDVIP